MSQEQQNRVTVHVEYKGVKQTFTGNIDDVWVGVHRFFAKMIPALDVIQKVLLTVDLKRLIEDCEGVIAVTPEGPTVLVSNKMLTDSDALTLHLLSAYVGHRMGLLDDDTLVKEELQVGLGKSSKITSTRLGELCREGLVAKTEEDRYRILTLGIRHLQEETLPKIKAKLQA